MKKDGRDWEETGLRMQNPASSIMNDLERAQEGELYSDNLVVAWMGVVIDRRLIAK